MLRNLLFILLILSSISASSQARFGIKLGVNVSDLILRSDGDESYSFPYEFSSTVNPLVGVSLKAPLNERFSFMAEMEVKSKGYQIKAHKEIFYITYLSVPLLIRYDPHERLFFCFGPEIGFALSQHVKIKGRFNEFGLIDIGKDFSMNLAAGARFRDNLEVALRYNPSISRLSQTNFTDDSGQLKNTVTSYHNVLCLEFRYFLKNKE
jgi:hypothetical protein